MACMRLFLSHGHAMAYVRDLADVDGPNSGRIYEHDIEAGMSIVMPGGETSLAVNGSFRVDGKVPKNMRPLN